MADEAGQVMGQRKVHFLGLPQESISGCGAINAECVGQQPGDVHNNPAVDAIFLGLGEEGIGLVPRDEGGVVEGAQHSPFTQLLGHVNCHIFAVSDG